MLSRAPLLRAVLQSYRNALVRAYRSNPALMVLAGFALVTGYLAILAVQLQAVASSIDPTTLSQLHQDQLGQVSDAAMTSVAAIAAAVHLVLGLLGTLGPGLRMIARRGLPTRWSRAWSLSAVDIGVSVVMALAFSGPLCALTTYQVDRLDGSAAGPALLGSTAMTLAAAIGGATTSLAALGVVRWLGRRARSQENLAAIALVVQGLVLITAVALVLAGDTRGLWLLLPGAALWGKVGWATLGLLVTALASLAIAVWGAEPGSVTPISVRRTRAILQSWSVRPGLLGGVTLLRDPMVLGSALLAIAGGFLVRILVSQHILAVSQGGLLILVLVGLVGLSMITTTFAISHSLWVVRSRPHGLRTLASQLVGWHALAVIVIALFTLAAAGYVTDIALVLLSVAAALLSSQAALVWSLTLFRKGTSAEHRGVLVVAGLLSTVTIGLLWTGVMHLPVIPEQWFTLAAVVLGVAAIIGVVTTRIPDSIGGAR